MKRSEHLDQSHQKLIIDTGCIHQQLIKTLITKSIHTIHILPIGQYHEFFDNTLVFLASYANKLTQQKFY